MRTGVPFAQNSITCDLPSLTMAPGTTATLEVAVTAGTTWQGPNTLQNCADLDGTPGMGEQGAKKACAGVKLDPFALKHREDRRPELPAGRRVPL